MWTSPLLSYGNMTAPTEVKRAAYERMVRHTRAVELVIDVERFALADAADAWRCQASGPRKKRCPSRLVHLYKHGRCIGPDSCPLPGRDPRTAVVAPVAIRSQCRDM